MISDLATNFLNEIKVYDCEFSKIRIGNNCDGGYVAVHEIANECSTLISFGVEDNVTFEIDWVNKYPNTSVELFDHTVNSLPLSHENFTFTKKGVAAKSFGDFLSLSSILESYNSGITMKMDIEWDEWEVIKSVSPGLLSSVDQILIEFHFAFIDVEKKFIPNQQDEHKLTPYFCNFYKTIYNKINEELCRKYYEILSFLNSKFYAVHIHPNNSLKKINIGGCEIPPLIEMTYVRKDLIEDAKETNQKFPIVGLDYPNKPYKKELGNYYPLIRKTNVE